jgi:Coenzyme PQQ synthesis protein D (PqqD)
MARPQQEALVHRARPAGDDSRPAEEPAEAPSGHAEDSYRIGVAPFRGGVVLHDPRTGRLFQLNHTAARVWQSLRASAREKDIIDDLARRHGVDPAEVLCDVQAFVDSLRRAGLLRRRDAGELQAADQDVRAPPLRPALVAAYQVGEIALKVVCHPKDVAAAFTPLAAPARVADDTPVEGCLTLFRHHGTFALTRDDRVVERADTAPAARWALVRQLASTAGRGPSLALLHAGAVATPTGCLLICGQSGAGKSTLLAGLVHAGFTFVADDIVPLEEGTGLVRPVRLAISIKQDSWPLVGALFPELAGAPTVRFGDRTMRYLWPAGAARAIHALRHPVAAVLFPHYGDDDPAGLCRLDPERSLALLGEGGSILPSEDSRLAEFLAWWSGLPAYQLSYHRLGDAVREVAALAGSLRNGHDASAGSPPAHQKPEGQC